MLTPIVAMIVEEIDPTVNPAGVESSMRLKYDVLNALPRSAFVKETKWAKKMEKTQPGKMREIADEYGYAAEYDEWEAENR